MKHIDFSFQVDHFSRDSPRPEEWTINALQGLTDVGTRQRGKNKRLNGAGKETQKHQRNWNDEWN